MLVYRCSLQVDLSYIQTGISGVYFWVLNFENLYYSPGASIIMGLHYCHITLDFCEMNSVFKDIFRVLLFVKYFFPDQSGFSQ